MARRVFISYQHEDRSRAKGFNLLRWSINCDVEFVGRHLLDPVNSENERYIEGKVKEQLHGTSVTIVLLGEKTCNSKWVAWEILQSLEKSNPNGILAIRLHDNTDLPDGCPVGEALKDTGTEIINWSPHEFADAIERAAIAAGRIKAIACGTRGGGSCGR